MDYYREHKPGSVTKRYTGDSDRDRNKLTEEDDHNQWAAHLGTSSEDIAIQKRCLDEKFITTDVMGLLAEVTHADIDTWPKSEPNVKGKAEVRDIKVRFDSPDLAIVTYAGTYTTTGHKDKRDDYKAEFVSIDTLRKKNSQWKVLADANTSTEPVATSLYKVAP